MKKKIVLLCSAVLALCIMGCGKGKTNDATQEATEVTEEVTTEETLPQELLDEQRSYYKLASEMLDICYKRSSSPTSYSTKYVMVMEVVTTTNEYLKTSIMINYQDQNQYGNVADLYAEGFEDLGFDSLASSDLVASSFGAGWEVIQSGKDEFVRDGDTYKKIGKGYYEKVSSDAKIRLFLIDKDDFINQGYNWH